MGSLENVRQGPDFKQSKKPTDHSTGRLWFGRDGERFSMADGVDYWGRTEPTRGYTCGGVANEFTPTPTYYSTVERFFFNI